MIFCGSEVPLFRYDSCPAAGCPVRAGLGFVPLPEGPGEVPALSLPGTALSVKGEITLVTNYRYPCLTCFGGQVGV